MLGPAIIPLLFFVSGFTGLVYEVVWARALAYTFGNTALAQTAVLAAFLGGLAAGNAWLGGLADRGRPLRLYAALELGVAALAAASPLLLKAASSLYIAVAPASPLAAFAARAAAGALVVFLPAALMGGTLPALARHGCALPASLASLYAVNSAGAAAGALAAAFLFVPRLGMTGSLVAAAAANGAIGLAALALARSREAPPAPRSPGSGPPRPGSGPPRAARAALGWPHAAVFISGAVALSWEIGWTRLLALVLGSSVYSFAVMLSAFISGVAAGSWLVARAPATRRDPAAALGAALAGAALFAAAGVLLCERLPYTFWVLAHRLPPTPAAFAAYEGIKLLLCAALMLAPTICLGASLPLACAAAEADGGAGVGRVFAANTAGNVLGAILAGLWLLPALGFAGLIQAAAALQAAAGAWGLARAGRSRAAAAAAALAVLAAGLARLPADRALFARGDFRLRLQAPPPSFAVYRALARRSEVLYCRDDADGTVTVTREPDGKLLLKTNGKTDAGTGPDMMVQVLLGHLPLMLHDDPQDILVVGLGSGVTAGSALKHPLRGLDIVEISGAVAEASAFFREPAGDPLADPRAALHLEDARTFLALPGRLYDVIASEPSNPWMAGVGNVFSEDFYRAARARLRPGGIMEQWFHLYEMDEVGFRLALRTFAAVFPNVTLWDIGGTDLILLGSEGPLEGDPGRLEGRLARPAVAADLSRVGVGRVTTLLSLQAASDHSVRQAMGSGPLNTDDTPLLEYAAPKAFFFDRTVALAGLDERTSLRAASELIMTRHLLARGRGVDRKELEELQAFRRASIAVRLPKPVKPQ